ncbi:cysteine peptidase family C39 domain-containing protein [Nitrospirillum sp. BR 11163]|uniref:cysteine peptidase family C39 domain-containing protein n=1 Tax=Nitrospirillum sp. BR 11163 TaxID=3104323 RepID=UPI002AFE8A79|nr:cysteine peptidase family C39 domain-containing protein [Nitrospirillum sp. BR 11163]MEA1672865.1 cysteine peptidase family C39 domain-containing protein [Nitrospirillum sp. BR 11163]
MKIARTPVFQQMERAECGAACLGAILGHHGRWVALEQLRLDCGVSRDGSRASNILKAARHHGLKADGYNVDARRARGTATPFIAFWKQSHFLVVEGFSGAKVHVNDPAIGRRALGRREFEESFSGVVLTFKPGPDFRPGGVRPSLMAGVRRRFRQSRQAILFIALVSLAMALPALLAPNFSKLFVDYYLVKRYEDWLVPLLGALVATALLQGGLTWLQQTYLLRLETRISVTSTSAVIRRLVSLPIAFFNQRSPSELAVRGTQTEGLAMLLASGLGASILALPSLLLFAGLMTYYDAGLGLLALSFAALDFAVLGALARTLAERNQAVMIQQTKITAAAAGGLRMIADYKANGGENLLFTRITGLKARQESLNAAFAPPRYLLQSIPVGMNGLAMAALLTLGGLKVMAGDVSVGVLVAFQALLGAFMGPVSQLVGQGQQLQTAQAYITQIDDTMRQPVSPEFADARQTRGVEAAPLSGAVRLRGVSFGYSRLEPPLIHDVDLAIAPGEWVAVVGRSGSGKSTLARLVAGMEFPWSGEVLLDDRPLPTLPRTVLRNSVAVVDQAIVIFEGTVRDNIALWDPTLTDETIIDAARLIGVHDRIVGRPGGYHARLSEDGANLSGGEKALIDLARAVATRPSILVLDEATAALDAVTEDQVMLNLRALGCTGLIIAHRLSAVRDADRIVVMEEGRIADIGTHAELLARSPHYQSLVGQA